MPAKITPIAELTKPQLEALVKLLAMKGQRVMPSAQTHQHFIAVWRAGYAVMWPNEKPFGAFAINGQREAEILRGIGLSKGPRQ